MIKYNAVQKKYLYKREDIDKIIEHIQNGNFYNEDNCTQEKIMSLAKMIDDFMNHIKIISENVVLERNETEEEARKYFGDEFISKFDQLLTSLDNQETVVAIHGTSTELCPNICEEGLEYRTPSLSSTAVQQKMNWGQKEMHYEDYEGLLNWKHKQYKGLVILAIPYECFYKEGLWNHFQDSRASAYGVADYKIDPDFIVGYIDVTNKNIVLNPKYTRQHHYTDYVEDNELFRKQDNMDNESLKQAMRKRTIQPNAEIHSNESSQSEEKEFDMSRTPYIIEELIGEFNSIKLGFPDGMSESRYNDFLEQLSYGFNEVLKNISLLKTEEQVKEERKERLSMFNEHVEENNQSEQSDFTDIEWDDNIDWEDTTFQETHKEIHH